MEVEEVEMVKEMVEEKLFKKTCGWRDLLRITLPIHHDTPP